METTNLVITFLLVTAAGYLFLRRPKDLSSNIREDAKLEEQQGQKKQEISELKEGMKKTEEEQKANPTPEDFWRHN